MDNHIVIQDAIYTKSKSIDSNDKGFEANYKGFKTESTILKAGHQEKPGYRKTTCDIIFERDVAVELRDGTIIYTDVFRPVTEEEVPAIIAWSPYGKNGSGNQHLASYPGRMGVAKKDISLLQKFEGPDPVYWCAKGYAVVNPDVRGAFMSEGNIAYWGIQDAQDGYDFIEWTAKQPWCTGKTALSGNSWLAVSQWGIAQLNPPHLACISPWEGTCFMYADDVCRGGIPNKGFCDSIIEGLFGNNYTENPPVSLDLHPLCDSYWKSKIPDFSLIRIPAYVVASYTSPVHTNGTFYAYRNLASSEKWLRVHNSQEWADYYAHEDDLCAFFDHYLKEKSNGWEMTPKVRLSVLDLGGKDVVDRPESDFPLPHTKYKKLYLDCASGSLGCRSESDSIASYDTCSANPQLVFRKTFTEDTEITGYSYLKIWAEVEGYGDMDIFVYISKLGRDNNRKTHYVVRPKSFFWRKFFEKAPLNALKYHGPSGRLRASVREGRDTCSSRDIPVLSYDNQSKLKPHEIVPLVIPLWPTGMIFHTGETLELTISGVDLAGAPLPGIEPCKYVNKGKHVFHSGGKFDSYLQLPFV